MTASDNLRPASPDTAEPLAEMLEGLGYTVIPPAASDTRALRNRMTVLANDLALIEGLTRRGAVLPEAYRDTTLQSLRRAFDRLFDALAAGEPCVHPWQIREANDGR